ncbi:YHS domain-containing protein [Modicisalibacter ilicicola DSM 19980]|uniref:YHS domain-containing protein n=1 Tax=Modicisalibacter ilicicola DSM 19980 TaxID=1121942 RepID=A0A1M5ESM7_9GAMM|nr:MULTISPECIES: YHS domain-containing protein [Halomonas]ERS91664.1 50S ribosomal protein L24 [Halomonas sp. PBN3]SHF82022.1 YHS domain-containing protein [Halomonas ilicicola DSM 19980]
MKRERVEQKSFVDPVCGMQVSYKTAAAESDYHGKHYYFCATACREQFDADPARYVRTHRQHGSRRG